MQVFWKNWYQSIDPNAAIVGDRDTAAEPDGAERIRVLFLLGSLHSGGSERQIIELLRRLDRAVFQPLLYTIYREGPARRSSGRHARPLVLGPVAFPRCNFPGLAPPE